MKIAVIGCGAAGGTAVQFARKTNRNADVTIYDAEGYGQYSKCALPFVLEGKPYESIIEFPPTWFEKNHIEYRHERVSAIDLKRCVAKSDGEEHYDVIILATGAIPTSPFPVHDVFYLRGINDALAIKSAKDNADTVLIIGAGLIGLEVAEALSHAGLDVTVLEYMSSILPTMLDPDMADYLMKHLNVGTVLGCRVEKAYSNHVVGGESRHADMVIVATGNTPTTPFGSSALSVDDHCRYQENVFAAGDCTSICDFFGRSIKVGLGTIAARQGKVAGINAAGGEDYLFPTLQTKTSKLFGLEVASVGLLAHELEGVTGKYTGSDLPHYMDGREIVVKVNATKKGIVVGCQALGYGAAKIIDRMALAVYNRMNVKEIAKIENAYAPSVAPTFDAVEIACSIVERKLPQ